MKSGKKINNRRNRIVKSRKNQEKIRTLEERETYKHLGILVADTIKTNGDEWKNKSTLDERENFWKPSSAVVIFSNLGHSLCKIFGMILKMDKGSTQAKRPKNWELMTMHKALRPKDDIDTICSKKWGRGLVRIEDSVDASIRQLENYNKKSKERINIVANNRPDNTRTNRTRVTRKQKKEEKQLHFFQATRLACGYGKETFREKLNLW